MCYGQYVIYYHTFSRCYIASKQQNTWQTNVLYKRRKQLKYNGSADSQFTMTQTKAATEQNANEEYMIISGLQQITVTCVEEEVYARHSSCCSKQLKRNQRTQQRHETTAMVPSSVWLQTEDAGDWARLSLCCFLASLSASRSAMVNTFWRGSYL